MGRLILVIGSCAGALAFSTLVWNRKVTFADPRESVKAFVVFTFMIFGGHMITQLVTDLIRWVASHS